MLHLTDDQILPLDKWEPAGFLSSYPIHLIFRSLCWTPGLDSGSLCARMYHYLLFIPIQTHSFTISIIICWIRNKYLNIKGGLGCRTWSGCWFRTWSTESNYRWRIFFSPQPQKEWPRLDVCRGVWVPLSLWRTSLTMAVRVQGPMAMRGWLSALKASLSLKFLLMAR